MRYSEDHKAKTHQRIVDEAALRFRRDGVLATGLQPLMKALGLTHGGFYAHFKSKDDLVEQALQQSADQLKDGLTDLKQAPNPLQELIKRYLSAAHGQSPGLGCPLPTMSAELGQRGQPSPVTDRIVRDRLQTIAGNLSGEDAEKQSALILSAMVGALVLSRSVTDPELAELLRAGTRDLLLQQTEA
ncbi:MULTISPECIES: TetR/AcrR family transcriptional regulator [unclassified Pseudomonas]|uniref:TetR/AcrR family transcriptional regulator n=1 Tax=unclassified Pseudomonas TaxID=196821 RepID=UPI00244C20F8|nr:MULTISPECIES: TetR/AcrR family transcriptional regulator [unclassified Pseudomonas]MDG9924391.1 TetR/AcrR family transcriptional regulator [Pseudomonas sp. GD04045]MDH0035269.1 TetR/AcrR family transcriptional regulator [Pseudomonas sp. GD04019]